jgi:hypothetical protein
MENAMTLTEQVLAHAKDLPEGALISAKGLLHLANRAAVDQTLSRLARRQQLMRVGRGIYVRPVRTKYGVRSPMPEKIIQELSNAGGETIVSSGAAAANALGLTTQVPIKTVYLTSGRSRQLALGKQTIELRHAKPRQLVKAHEQAGQAARALTWLGRERAGQALSTLRKKLSPESWSSLQEMRPSLPDWLAESVSANIRAHG